MGFIIITRHVHGGLTAITGGTDMNDPNPPIMEFVTREDAIETAEDNPLCVKFGYNILEVFL